MGLEYLEQGILGVFFSQPAIACGGPPVNIGCEWMLRARFM